MSTRLPRCAGRRRRRRRALSCATSRAAYERFYRQRTGGGIYAHDASAVACALDPSRFQVQHGALRVVTEGLAMGQTIQSRRGLQHAATRLGRPARAAGLRGGGRGRRAGRLPRLLRDVAATGRTVRRCSRRRAARPAPASPAASARRRPAGSRRGLPSSAAVSTRRAMVWPCVSVSARSMAGMRTVVGALVLHHQRQPVQRAVLHAHEAAAVDAEAVDAAWRLDAAAQPSQAACSQGRVAGQPAATPVAVVQQRSVPPSSAASSSASRPAGHAAPGGASARRGRRGG